MSHNEQDSGEEEEEKAAHPKDDGEAVPDFCIEERAHDAMARFQRGRCEIAVHVTAVHRLPVMGARRVLTGRHIHLHSANNATLARGQHGGLVKAARAQGI